MLESVDQAHLSKKRKRLSADQASESHPRRTTESSEQNVAPASLVEYIQRLEDDITQSQRNYNSIATLIELAQDKIRDEHDYSYVLVSLCRVFSRLLAAGRLTKSKEVTDSEITVVRWLRERYKGYKSHLLNLLFDKDGAKRTMAMTLTMHLVKVESSDEKCSLDSVWRTGIFRDLLCGIIQSPGGETTGREFISRYAQGFGDVRYYTFNIIGDMLAKKAVLEPQKVIVSNCLSMLSCLEYPTDENNSSNANRLFNERPYKTHTRLSSLSSQRKQAQQAWLTLLHAGLDQKQRKKVLSIMTPRVVPWVPHIERLMDFITDSYNVGGATSLLALSGLFHLIKEKNLDYPAFYHKLYALLDSNILHSKHRSKFFRLLNVFMSSTHLPSALVASFIKRLSRLALHAPPAGIIAVIPFVYNMLKSHPSCTFMIHREQRNAEVRAELDEEGMDDPFNMEEFDPTKTNALDSSLWELETLQSHYHPNVASLARIISEQFTKASYNLEDFLDHSYGSLIEAELRKELKTTPAIEFDIPKKVFTLPNEETSVLHSLMQKVLE